MLSAHGARAALQKRENIGHAYISTAGEFLSNYFAIILLNF